MSQVCLSKIHVPLFTVIKTHEVVRESEPKEVSLCSFHTVLQTELCNTRNENNERMKVMCAGETRCLETKTVFIFKQGCSMNYKRRRKKAVHKDQTQMQFKTRGSKIYILNDPQIVRINWYINGAASASWSGSTFGLNVLFQTHCDLPPNQHL